jgi:hypothetical protein
MVTSRTLPDMPPTRIAKTFDRLRAGELPPPTGVAKFAAGGLGTACSGCGEPIARSEYCYFIRLGQRAGAGTLLGFHPVCHETWVRFKR